MPEKILILLGNPACQRKTFCEALATSYQRGAIEGSHEVRLLKIADLQFDPILHEGYKGIQFLEPDIANAQSLLLWASHVVIVYPLWQFGMPALLKGFFERTLIKGFAFEFDGTSLSHSRFLKGKSARIIQTMAMSSLMYRWFARQHGAKALKNTLNFCGIAPVQFSYFGMAEKLDEAKANVYMNRMWALGRRAA